MQLGTLSIRLTVKDIEASRSFYEKFGFKVFGGDANGASERRTKTSLHSRVRANDGVFVRQFAEALPHCGRRPRPRMRSSRGSSSAVDPL